MKKVILIISTLLIFAYFNYAIYQKDNIKKNGETVFLKLAPTDFHSRNFMLLNYDIAQNHSNLPKIERGYIVLGLDENKIATFKRFYEGEPLASDEKLIHYQVQYGKLYILPNSFMFQESHAESYLSAKYSVFKFDGSTNYLLTALANANLQIISPTEPN